MWKPKMSSTSSNSALLTGATGGAILVVAKCPIPGKSKTRLIPLLGESGSASLARSMLSDVLLTLTHCRQLDSTRKILLYAPGTEEGRQKMEQILHEIGIDYCLHLTQDNAEAATDIMDQRAWRMMPMKAKNEDLQSSDLGDILEHALDRTRHEIDPGSVVFIGMDSPVLPLTDIVQGLGVDTEHHLMEEKQLSVDRIQTNTAAAWLCPADDGGYGMLCVPPQADSRKTFRNIPWSTSLTAMAQIKALTDQQIPIRIGTLMHDLDEPEDVLKLVQRIKSEEHQECMSTKTSTINTGSILNSPSAEASQKLMHTSHPTLFHTRKALQDAGLVMA